MKKNVGNIDKYIRIILGLTFVTIGYRTGMFWATLLGAVLFFTGWFERCVIYWIIGFTTCKSTQDVVPVKTPIE